MRSKVVSWILILVMIISLLSANYGVVTVEAATLSSSNIDKIMNKMSLHDKICQMFILRPGELPGGLSKDSLKKNPIGGFIYFSENMSGGKSAVKQQISALQGYSTSIYGIPLFISVDEEGGTVARCADNLGTTKFSNMYEYHDKGADTAKSNAKTIAKDIKAIGFNLDFAPVADTWSNSGNTIIGKRAYSTDFSEAATLVAAAVKGFKAGGVLCTLKHFPGHGDTAAGDAGDSHKNLPHVSKSLDKLKKEEFKPFKAGIDAGAEFVMVAHIVNDKVDSKNPASVSKKFITDILRGDLGFNGLVITDAMDMAGFVEGSTQSKRAVQAVKAGVDVLLCASQFESCVSAIESAVNSGDIKESRINESVKRILKTKAGVELSSSSGDTEDSGASIDDIKNALEFDAYYFNISAQYKDLLVDGNIYLNAIICFTGIKSRCGSKLGRLRTASEVL